MLEVGLTGCRFSGKTSVSKLFRKIGVPVFDADIILKFILNFKPKVELAIMSNVGSFVYKNGFLDPTCFLADGLFDRTIDVIEFELFQAWERFKDKHKDHSYVIISKIDSGNVPIKPIPLNPITIRDRFRKSVGLISYL